MRGSNFAGPVGVPGPPVKRNRVAMEQDGDESEQAFSTAKDEYVRHSALLRMITSLWLHDWCITGQAAAA